MSFFFPVATACLALDLNDEMYRETTHGILRLAWKRESLVTWDPELIAACNLFGYEIRKYYGLGFLASFISGTAAYRARIILADEVGSIVSILKREMDSVPDWYWRRSDLFGFRRRAFRAALNEPVLILITLGPIWELFDDRFIWTNLKVSLAKLVSYFPILSEIYYVDEYRKAHLRPAFIRNLIHIILNPMLLIERTLFFIQSVLRRIIEIGYDKGGISNFRRRAPKMLIVALFVPLRVVAHIVGIITDIPYKILNNLVYNPLTFLYSAIKQAFSNTALFAMETQLASKVTTFAEIAHTKLITDNNLVANKKNALIMGLDKKAKNHSTVKIFKQSALGECRLIPEIFDFAFDKKTQIDPCINQPASLNCDSAPLSATLSLFASTKQDAVKIHDLASLVEETNSSIDQAVSILKK